jgi:hypothetical protein
MCLQKKLDAMADELQELLTRSQVLGEQGDVDGAHAAAIQADAIKADHAPCLSAESMHLSPWTEQVCVPPVASLLDFCAGRTSCI